MHHILFYCLIKFSKKMFQSIACHNPQSFWDLKSTHFFIIYVDKALCHTAENRVDRGRALHLYKPSFSDHSVRLIKTGLTEHSAIRVSVRYSTEIAQVWEENESLVNSIGGSKVAIRGSYKISVKTGHPVLLIKKRIKKMYLTCL